jgi:hypothetical protein
MFRGAYSRWPNVKILLNMGTALRQLGRNVEAAETYEKYLADPAADSAKKTQVQGLVTALSAQLGKLKVEVNEPGARVLVDGKALGTSPQSISLRVEPGSHSVVAEKEGYALSAATVSVAAGQERVVELRLVSTAIPKAEPAAEVAPQPAAPTTAEAAAPSVERAATTSNGRTKTIAGAVVMSVGAALAIGGIVCGVLAKQSSDYITNLDRTMQPYDSARYQAGQTEQLMEGVLLGIGGAATVAGAVVLVLGRREARNARADAGVVQKLRAASLVPALSARSVGASVQLKF